LSAAGRVQPGKSGAHLPESMLAVASKLLRLLSVQPAYRHDPSSTFAPLKKFAAVTSVQPSTRKTHHPGSVAFRSKLSALSRMHPRNLHEPSSMSARGRKLAAVESVQPRKTGGQVPRSKVANGSYASTRLSMQPPTSHEASSTTANAL